VNQTPEKILADTKLVVRRGPYTLAAWQPSQLSAVFRGILRCRQEHTFVTADELEVTAFVATKHLGEFPPPKHNQDNWCLLTLDTVMEWDVVGVLAAVSRALAEASVPMGAVTAYSRDHLLVGESHLDQAQNALSALCKDISVVD
jgi:uncharacterized protein